MDYNLSVDVFDNSPFFNSNRSFTHKTNIRFKLFPFTANNNSETVKELDALIGAYFREILDKEPPKEDILSSLVLTISKDNDVDVSQGDKEYFQQIIRQMFFDSCGNVLPIDIGFMEQIPCDSTRRKLAEFLVDVLGSKDRQAESIRFAHKEAEKSGNVLENYVLSKLKLDNKEVTRTDCYFRVIDRLVEVFDQDFEYILSSPDRLKNGIVSLMELYYFSYTSQTALQLNRFMDGERNGIVPLYFCLDWEKTSQSRKCYSDGWKKLQNNIKCIFAHAVVLELLNQTKASSVVVDYIKLAEISQSDEQDEMVAKCIDDITKRYRESITDCIKMDDIKKEESPRGKTAASLQYLYKSVKTQFENSVRERAYTAYEKKFEDFCSEKYLKDRGRNGKMLSISEEMLIFLTKLSIKEQDQLRLKDVFHEFEKRGIFLDDISKDQVANYYEKLNLVEKKSDSGDAKYVKRIL